MMCGRESIQMWEEMAVLDQPEHLADLKGLINLLQEQGAILQSFFKMTSRRAAPV